MTAGLSGLTTAVVGGSPHCGHGGDARVMRAARIYGYGGAEVLRIENTPVPTPGPGQVRVRVVASGVNPLDWRLREGWLKDIAPRALPLTLGSDLSGVVDRVGAGVSELGRGMEVFGRVALQSQGTFAEYVLASASDLVAKPKCLSHLEAAALPLAGLTARAALEGLKENDRVLILGGAGGVGHLAVQLAKLYGAWVAATASRSNLEFVSSLGADAVIERDCADLSSVLAPFGRVVDTVGNSALTAARNVIKRDTRVRSIAAVSPTDSDPAALAILAHLVAAGRMRIEIPRVFPLIEVGRALALSQSGHARGKIVLSVLQH